MKRAPVIYDRAMHEARKYWRDRLPSMAFEQHIGLDHPRPISGEPCAARFEQEIDADVHQLLRRLTSGDHFLLLTTFLTALKICCRKFSGRSSVTIFTPAATKGGAANLLPISSTLDGKKTFKDLLVSTKDLLSGAYGCQQYPFSSILSDIPDMRRPQHLAMVAAMAGISGEMYSGSDVAIVFKSDETSTKAVVDFNRSIYEVSTISHFLRSLNAILRQALGHMAKPITDFHLDDHEFDSDSPRDSGDVKVKTTSRLADSGGTEAVPHEGVRLYRLVEARAAEQPEGVAVVDGDRITTYGMLTRYVDQLAAMLATQSLDSRRPIVIAMEASTESIVSMLAAAKTGIPFLPIMDNTDMALAVRTFDCKCVLCRRDGALTNVERLDDVFAGISHLVNVDCSAPTADGESSVLQMAILNVTSRDGRFVTGALDGDGEPASVKQEGPGSTAGGVYVLGTDGDGDLRQSEIAEAELLSLLQWLNLRHSIGRRDRSIVLPGCGVSEQFYGTLGMLIAGGSVEIPDRTKLQQGLPLAELLLATQATVWNVPTALMQNTLASLVALQSSRPQLHGPRTILLSGEKQCCSLARKLARCFPGARITGLYASSNNEVWTTYFPFDEPANAEDSGVIGHPIPGFEHLVLGENGDPVPVQTKGELHLMRRSSGYVSASGLRVKRLRGGGLGWLRGPQHRFFKGGCWVELTDLEETLCRHDHILAAEVITATVEGESETVVLGIVIADPALLSSRDVQNFVISQERVDLVPDHFIVTEEFPLTNDGAVDCKAVVSLYAGDRPRSEAPNGEAAAIHTRLKAIWLEALQLADVGDDDSFFARGGNSLKATLLMARIKNEFSVELPVQDFFRRPTTRAVAQLILALVKNAKGLQKPVELKPVSRERYRVRLADADGAMIVPPR